MVDVPTRKQVVWTYCTLDGKNRSREQVDCGNHMSIILSRKEYNRDSNSVLGVPLSSLKDDSSRGEDFRLNFGIDINDNDFERKDSFGRVKIERATVVLCDRPSRIDKGDIERSAGDAVIVSDSKYDEIVNGVNNYIKAGKIRDEVVPSA